MVSSRHPAPGRKPATPRAGPKPKILIVEDDDRLRSALEAGLSSEGFTVHLAPDAGAAYAMASDIEPDLILLDWIMPGSDGGLVACRRLRAIVPGSAIVMFSGLSDVRDQRAALEAGARAFLVKGISLDALAGKLRGFLEA